MAKKGKQYLDPKRAAQAAARLNQPSGVRRDGLADRKPGGFWARLFGGKR